MITAHVVYATITGNNEDIADIVTEYFEDAGVKVTETEISQTDPSVFEDVDICVVCPYTYDEAHCRKKDWIFTMTWPMKI
ncbi:flavodoxin [Lentilactobacillus farraginis DSM 18382 = JCM 14108]|uniref:Flavodoxin n=1 Tax=Lentilactobacillus farraginis DSM 18382 = JCM 14108 TaxID=1423743 RepID=X0PIM6_9LACO|nr:flavodoxin [Lentilactobacillus farraginis DSM 18382 = JCM 14108]